MGIGASYRGEKGRRDGSERDEAGRLQSLLHALSFTSASTSSPADGPGEQVLKKYKKESDDTYSMSDICPVRFVPLLPDIAAAEEVAA